MMLREILPNIAGPMLADLGPALRLRRAAAGQPELPRPGRAAARRPTGARWCARTSARSPCGGAAVIAPALAIASLTIAVNLVIDNLPGRAARERGATLMGATVVVDKPHVVAAPAARTLGRCAELHHRARRGARADRRIRLGQDHDRAGADGLCAPRLPHQRRQRAHRRRRRARADARASCARCAAARVVLHRAERGGLVQPVAHDHGPGGRAGRACTARCRAPKPS